MNKTKKIAAFYLLSIILIIIDQITKIWVKGFNFLGIHHEGFNFGETHSLIGSFLSITFVENNGMAFGIGFDAGKIVLSAFRTIASLGIIYYLYKLKNFPFIIRLGVSFILAGAVGNLIDSLFYGLLYGYSSFMYGRVVDFIQVDIPDFSILGFSLTHWWIFNIADACVTAGIAILLIFHKQIPSMKEVFSFNKKRNDITISENNSISENL